MREVLVGTPRHFLKAGQRIGRGTVIDPEICIGYRPDRPTSTRRGARLCCDCGTVYEALVANLIEHNGRIGTTSCGCAQREASSKFITERNRTSSARTAELRRLAGERQRAALTARIAEVRAAAEAVRWLPVAGYENLYAVSDLGHVQSLKTGRLLKPQLDRKGYLIVGNSRDGRSVTRKVHRIVAEAFIGPCPEGQQVRHVDGVKVNVAASNLAYGTPSENMLDQVRHGTHYEASRTHCDSGHEFTPENTYTGPGGSRVCKACRGAATRAARERNLEEYRRRGREAERRRRAKLRQQRKEMA
jgi:HNH endonuclease/NUMOD4 motif